MTISTLIISFAIVGAILTFLTSRIVTHKSWFLTFLQNFTGVWFIFSGFVKAVDPYGTAIKMEQYFADFETTIKGTALKGISGVFPVLSHNAMTFSIIMILLELLVGVMLILGYRSKLTSWLFLIIIAFFTVLTGYTHLTGYVPSGVNFFEFSKWGAFDETNRRVTDCGCFGDFLKLDPRISFYKDLFLSAIALIFVFRYKGFTALFTSRIRGAILTVVGVVTLLFCFRNAFWNEPMIDFRPFQVGINIRDRKKAEEHAMETIAITYVYKNKKSGQEVRLTMEEYMKQFKNFPKDEWDFKQEKGEPDVPHSKISDFSVSDVKGSDATDSILNEKNYLFLAVSYDLHSTVSEKKIVVPDTVFVYDTVKIAPIKGFITEPKIVKAVKSIGKKEETLKSFSFDKTLRDEFLQKLNPLLEAAEKAGYKDAALVAFADPHKIDDFRHETNSAYPFYTADDLVVKTMMRSNPGLFLLKDGQIIGKWHIDHLPTMDELKANYIK